MVNCDICGKETKNDRYCSLNCYWKYLEIRPKEEHPLYETKRESVWNKGISDERTKANGRKTLLTKGLRKGRLCPICGEYVKRFRKFCTNKCYFKAMRIGLVRSGFQKGYTPYNKGLVKELQPNYGKVGFMTGKKQSEHQKIVASKTHKGKIVSEETKQKMKHSKNDEKWYENICKANKANWQKPSYVRAQMKARKCKPNKEEIYVYSFLQTNFPNEWKFVGDGEFILAGKCPDFININGKKKLIEFFGDYWHKYSEEPERIAFFKQYGFDTLVIWAHDLRNEEKLFSRVSNFCRKGGD